MLRPSVFLLSLLLCADCRAEAASAAAAVPGRPGLSAAGQIDAAPGPHDAITAGCSIVGGGNLGSRCTASQPGYEPLLWAGPRASGGDKLGLQGTLPVAGWAGQHGAGRVLFWSMHEAMWGSGKDGLDDNDRFRQQAFAWLLLGRKRIGISTAHGTYVTAASLSANLRGWLDSQGAGYADEPQPATPELLASYDLLVVAQPQPWPQPEIDALAHWVSAGGSLLLCAQGWSWDYSQGEHPLSVIGAPFGLHICDGTVTDPAAPNGDSGRPAFRVQPLTAYSSASRVVVLKKGIDDLDSVRSLATVHPENTYVLEGDHFGLQVANQDWARLDGPAAAIDVLDRMYLNHLALTGGAAPYGGDVVWAISVDDPDGQYWMHSGNPIVMKQAAGASVVDNFNRYGAAGWGLAHELGHNMHGSACGNLFVPYGLAEPSCNIWSVWTYRQLGWDWACGHQDYAAAGVAYHNQPRPDLAQLKSDLWILLGCYDLIWQRYGWDGMQRFLTQAAADSAAGRQAGSDDERVAYLVEGISRGYSVDFSPLFLHWGFPVSAATQAYTDQWPDSEIPLP